MFAKKNHSLLAAWIHCRTSIRTVAATTAVVGDGVVMRRNDTGVARLRKVVVGRLTRVHSGLESMIGSASNYLLGGGLGGATSLVASSGVADEAHGEKMRLVWMSLTFRKTTRAAVRKIIPVVLYIHTYHMKFQPPSGKTLNALTQM